MATRRGYSSARLMFAACSKYEKLSRRRGQRRRKKKLTPVCGYIHILPVVTTEIRGKNVERNRSTLVATTFKVAPYLKYDSMLVYAVSATTGYYAISLL